LTVSPWSFLDAFEMAKLPDLRAARVQKLNAPSLALGGTKSNN
jgi:hypothetical protein